MLSTNGCSGPISISLFLKISATQIYFSFPIKVHNCDNHSHFTCFCVSITFRSPLMVSAAVLVTLIGQGSVDVKLRPKGSSHLRCLSTHNPVSLYPISYSLLELLLESLQEHFLCFFFAAFLSPFLTSDSIASVRKAICLSFPPPSFLLGFFS